ncbi:hypothetical protein OPV22_012581 [Ensete ventricosum]|uniref:Uncharacterized protein n=1 Tax=Ensete ventricosum TaxID=4639 RepID=A0AAV8QXF8_ENSVE|nr:hypothetical protein OPV22_012581 [Ensete ventricosum]
MGTEAPNVSLGLHSKDSNVGCSTRHQWSRPCTHDAAILPFFFSSSSSSSSSSAEAHRRAARGRMSNGAAFRPFLKVRFPLCSLPPVLETMRFGREDISAVDLCVPSHLSAAL